MTDSTNQTEKMNIIVRKYENADIAEMIAIWNDIVEDGVAYPQEEFLDLETGAEFFAEQTFTGVAENVDTGEITGLYILHPNNIGRCGHISNASYAVKKSIRNQHVGEKIVVHCQKQAKIEGYRILQFNAVVATNANALHLYKKLGFVQLGVIPEGFRMKDGHYEDIVPHYFMV